MKLTDFLSSFHIDTMSRILSSLSYKLYASLLILFCIASAVFCQSKKSVTLEEAIQLAMQNHPIPRASALDVRSAEGQLPTAFEIPKTEINAEFGQYSTINHDQAFVLSQTIPFPSTMLNRRKLLQAEWKVSQADHSVQLIELKSSVRKAYDDVLFYSHRKSKLYYLDSFYREFEAIASAKFRSGEVTKAELILAETAKGQMTLLLEENQVDLENSYRIFKDLLQESDVEIKWIGTTYNPMEILNLQNNTVQSHNPIIESFEMEAKLASRKLKFEKSQFLPEIKASYRNQSLTGIQTVDGQEEYFGRDHRFHVFSAGIGVPLQWKSMKAKIRSEQFRMESKLALLEYKKSMLLSELSSSWNKHEQLQRRHDHYVRYAIPSAQEIVRNTKTAYGAGEISYLEYLTALRTATEVELNALESIHALNSSSIQILRLSGQ